MTPELAALAALFKPRMQCVEHQPGHPPDHFTSATHVTGGGTLLVQRNYERGFEEIIVYAYDMKNHRFLRTQLDDQGYMTTAKTSGPVNGVWTFGGVRWRRGNGVSYFWEGSGTAKCR